MANENKVLLVLQAIEEARPIVQAIELDNPDAVVENQPAMIELHLQIS